MIHYIILDTETSGLKASFHEIHQISAISLGPSLKESPQISRDIRIKYPERVNLTSLQVSGKEMKDLIIGDHLLSIEEVVEQIESFFSTIGSSPEERCIVAHNAPFDQRFLWATWASLKKTFPASCWLCTQQISRLWAKSQGRKLESYSLESMIKFANIPERGEKHNATIDAQHACLLFKKMQEQKIDFLPLIKRQPHII